MRLAKTWTIIRIDRSLKRVWLYTDYSSISLSIVTLSPIHPRTNQPTSLARAAPLSFPTFHSSPPLRCHARLRKGGGSGRQRLRLWRLAVAVFSLFFFRFAAKEIQDRIWKFITRGETGPKSVQFRQCQYRPFRLQRHNVSCHCSLSVTVIGRPCL